MAADTPEGGNAVVPSSSTPPALDRGALERVLARAAALQGANAAGEEPMLTESQLLDVGREVGLAPEFLRQALAEERTRIALPEDSGLFSLLVGPGIVAASRVVQGRPERLLADLDALMQVEEVLRVKRRFTDRVLWEPRTGFAANLKRGLNVGGYGYHLSRAAEVAATVVPVDDARSLVHLSADIGNLRSQRLAGGGAVVALGVATTGTLLLLGFASIAAIVPVVGLGGVALLAMRGHRAIATRAQLTLEQALDRLERGEAPRSSLLSALSAAREITSGSPRGTKNPAR
ncbi:MAG TPA: hypothetical protein VEI06_08940 [Gemmatimonadaceae bacterium]|nr:hypothetical protein [Gemmatimonadaceae bacterium]